MKKWGEKYSTSTAPQHDSIYSALHNVLHADLQLKKFHANT
jgi:hypothetical protein